MNSKYSVRIEPHAWKQLMSFNQRLQEKLLVAIESLENEPRPSGCKKLKDRAGLFRVRVGDYRIIYDVMDAVLVVLVVEVGDRKEIYD